MPSIDPVLDAELNEPEEQRTRRLQWIAYYVDQGDDERAKTLGWDGNPFQSTAITARQKSTMRRALKSASRSAKSLLQLPFGKDVKRNSGVL